MFSKVSNILAIILIIFMLVGCTPRDQLATAIILSTSTSIPVAQPSPSSPQVQDGLYVFSDENIAQLSVIDSFDDPGPLIWYKELVPNTDIVFLQDGMSFLWTTSDDNGMYLGEWHFPSLVEREITSLSNSFGSGRFSPYGEQLMNYGGGRGGIIFYDIANGSEIRSLSGAPVVLAEISSNEDYVAVYRFRDSNVRFYNAEDMQLREIFVTESFVHDIEFSDDSTRVAVIDTNTTIYLWDTASLEEIAKIRNDGLLNTGGVIKFSPDGSYVAASIGTDAHVFNTSLGIEVASFPIGGVISSFAFNSTGNIFAVSSCDIGITYIYNIQSRQRLRLLETCGALAFNESDTLLVSISDEINIYAIPQDINLFREIPTDDVVRAVTEVLSVSDVASLVIGVTFDPEVKIPNISTSISTDLFCLPLETYDNIFPDKRPVLETITFTCTWADAAALMVLQSNPIGFIPILLAPDEYVDPWLDEINMFTDSAPLTTWYVCNFVNENDRFCRPTE